MLEFNQDDYASEWKIIDSLEQAGLPRSALEKVEALYQKATSDHNPSQIIKTLLYRSKYQSQLEEEGLVYAIRQLEGDLPVLDFPARPILQSILAGLYERYLEENYWRIGDRTATVGFDNDDPTTWPVDRFLARSAQLFRASLDYPGLKEVSLSGFTAITTTKEAPMKLRPTLYDFLAHRAIDYFMNERSYLPDPANRFYLEQPEAFAPVKEFVQASFPTTDTASAKYRTLLLFQDLLRFRLSAKDADALLDADLKRLQFAYQNSVAGNKEEAYLDALNALRRDFADRPMMTQVLYQMAQYYLEKGQSEAGPHEFWIKSHELCEEALRLYPESLGAANCRSIKQSLESRELAVEIEQVNLPNKPILAVLNYRNQPEVYFKLLRMNEQRKEEFQELRYKDHQQALTYLNGIKPLRTWKTVPPQVGDFRSHSVEIGLDALPFGMYAVVVSDHSSYGEAGNSGYLFFHVSELGQWYRPQADAQQEFAVFDRGTGQPLAGVTGEVFVQTYNSVFRRYNWKKDGVHKSDERGFLRFQLREKERQFKLLLVNGADSLDLDQSYSNYYRQSTPRSTRITHFFLDRAIYRPGQTVYFKGIVLEKDPKGMPRILPDQKVTVIFKDVNYQEVAKQTLTTNRYGTIAGTFTAPSSGLLGQMHLVSDQGNQQKYFRVEEYKRPRFEVTFEPVQGSYRLGEEVTVTGAAKGYAGDNIDGAKVQYRIVREARFPWLPWWYWRRYPYPSSPSMEIARGVLETDANGGFSVTFTAHPDRSVSKDLLPEFNYTVFADITDVTGETHSDQTSLSAGYVALRAELKVPSELEVGQFNSIEIATTNLNGQFEPASGQLVLEQLKSPERPFLNRFWELPDQHLLSKEEFDKAFPHLAYADEDQQDNWPVARKVQALEFNTAEATVLQLDRVKLQPGAYRLTLETKDKFGTAVSKRQHIVLYDPDGATPPTNELVWTHWPQGPFEPGQAARIQLAAHHKDQVVLFEVERDQQIIRSDWMSLRKVRQIAHSFEEADRGNVHFYLSYAALNRSFLEANTMQVPWTNKELSIEYGTFRDKLQPGQEEEWVLKIKGPKGDQVAAEMVAGMYDASLDQFAANSWHFSVFPTDHYQRRKMQAIGYQAVNWQPLSWKREQWAPLVPQEYPELNWFGLNYYGGGYAFYANTKGLTLTAAAADAEAAPGERMAKAPMREEAAAPPAPPPPPAPDSSEAEPVAPNEEPRVPQPVKVRSDLEETAFFFPQLETDPEGNIVLRFKMREALTRWKFLGLAHTTDLKSAVTERTVVTQKELMVLPNPPRFFREQDEIEFTAKVSNLSDKTLSGNAELQLVNPLNTTPVYKWLDNPQFNQNFTVEPGQSARLAWRFKVPGIDEVPMIEHTVVVAAGNFSDAERSAAPVLSNRMLVTEALPLPLRGNTERTFVFQSLADNRSTTLDHHRYTLEFTSNPAWYAVQALPYLMEYPYECTEQIFSRYYANALAASVANSHPKVKSVFDQWRDQPAMESNLAKNQELKSALLEETPWVLQALDEKEQKKQIGLLFDLNRMGKEQTAALDKLADYQLPGGGFAWFPGGRDNWYITQYIVEGFGHLHRLGVTDVRRKEATWRMVKDAVAYTDQRMIEYYDRLAGQVKRGQAKWEDDHLDPIVIHYLYTRSFYLVDQTAQANKDGQVFDKDQGIYIALDGKIEQVFDYFVGQAEKYWLNKGIYQEGMVALALQRVKKPQAPAAIVKSLKERSMEKEELGRYWKQPAGYFWYQHPIETQALMIEVFDEVAKDARAVEDLKLWLLKNKQTNHWKTTKATASAVYALLMNGDNWLLDDQPVQIQLGKKPDPLRQNAIEAAQASSEAGTGYFKLAFDQEQMSNDLATIEVSNPNKGPAWGAVYWQYFEQLDKIDQFEETPLTLQKQLFKVELGPQGEVLRPVAEGAVLSPGDKLKVRIELRVDRPMEYVHMKDMRASGLEPINVISRYKWQGGLGYYESTRDVSTNFFFSNLPTGTYVFEYPLRVVHKGDFSNGITTIQCMYAPEFTSHSEGVRIRVD